MWELEGRLRQRAPRDHLLQKRSEGLRGPQAAMGFGQAPVTMRVFFFFCFIFKGSLQGL